MLLTDRPETEDIDPSHLFGPGTDTATAFQPIADLDRRRVFAYEALVRGGRGEGAGAVLGRVPHAGRYAFDQACRVRALAAAGRLGLGAALSLNASPNGLTAARLRATLRAARHAGVPPDRLIVELTEDEEVADLGQVRAVVRECRARGVRVAIDDFGAGHAGLNLLADLTPDLIKLDIGLVRGVDTSPTRRAIARAALSVCRELGIGVVAEGVETPGELAALRDLGVRYVQGYLLARPAVEAMPTVMWPAERADGRGLGSSRHKPLTAEALSASGADSAPM